MASKKARKSIIYFLAGVLGFFATLSLGSLLAAESIPRPTDQVYIWNALRAPADYVEFCRYERGGVLRCVNSCAPGSGAICAEYSNISGDVDHYCCIDPVFLGTSYAAACLTWFDFIRVGPPEE